MGNAAEGMESFTTQEKVRLVAAMAVGWSQVSEKGHPKNGDFNRKKHGWWGAIHPLTCTVLWPYILSLHLAFSVKFHEVLGSLIFWGCIGYQSQMHYFVQPTRRRVVSKSVECCDFCWISGPLAQLNSWRWSTLVGLSGVCPRLKVSRLTYPTPANLDGVEEHGHKTPRPIPPAAFLGPGPSP